MHRSNLPSGGMSGTQAAHPPDRKFDRMKYRFAYSEYSPYGHALALLTEHTKLGLVVDLGCGFGAIAEPLRERGYDYLGIDLAPEGIANLAERGFRTLRCDLHDIPSLRDALAEIAVDTPIVAFTALDVIEHLPSPDPLVAALATVAAGGTSPCLVVSIPNVAHFDLAAKLMVGRWDVTPTGLLDATHVQLFTSTRVEATMAAHGWHELGRHDFPLTASDQAFPEGHPLSLGASPLSDLLRQVRGGTDLHAFTNQFVRIYRRGTPPTGPSAHTIDGGLLTLMLRHRAGTPHPQPTDAQVEVIGFDTDEDALMAAQQVRTGHVAFVEGNRLPAEGWMEALRDAVAQSPTAVVLMPCTRAGERAVDLSTLHSLIGHLPTGAPDVIAAFPAAAISDLGVLPTSLAPAATLAAAIRAATWCGLQTTQPVERPDDPHHDPATIGNAVLGELSAHPLLLPAGSVATLAHAHAGGEAARRRVAEIEQSATWRLMRRVRRLLPTPVERMLRRAIRSR